MKLCELCVGYLETAELLKQRLRKLRRQKAVCPDPEKRIMLQTQINSLSAIYAQCKDLAELTAHYYERGFYRNGKYTL